MKYIFFGGQESLFAEIILQRLTEAGFPPLFAIRDARQPIDLERLKNSGAEFFLVAAFAKILKADVISIPPRGTIGIHPSLLPLYRGASPIQSVLLNGETKTGTTLFLIDEKVDHGSILVQKEIMIESSDTYTTLLEKLAHISADAALESLPGYLSGTLKPIPQDDSKATYIQKITTADAEVDLQNPELAWHKIQALNPEPGAFTFLPLINGKKLRLKLLKADFVDGKLVLKEVQPEGKKPMTYEAFLNGHGRQIKK